MPTLKIHGTLVPAPAPPELARGLPAEFVVPKGAVQVQAPRAGRQAIHLDGLEPDDVVEITFDDGLRLWSRVDDLARDFRLARSRDADGDVITLPATLPIGGPSRGWSGWAIKGLKVFGLDLEASIGDFVAERVERRLKPGPGLYSCADPAAPHLSKVTRLRGAGPTLVLLHGTASSAEASFDGLWSEGAGSPIRKLIAQYDGRVLAFQHESLTKSPIENAAALAASLAELLEANAEVHLISHSRGGLIGELLARGMRVGAPPFTTDDFAHFTGDDRVRDRAALKELARTLQQSKCRITRFVRVACPARGTTLADGRLDRYFSVLVNLAGLVPGLAGNPVYDGLTSLLAGVLKRRTDPQELPGLEAMMPGSPLVLLLNTPDVQTGAGLHVLGGDLGGGGLFDRLKTWATDLYYRDDHDLVVNTAAMLGGTERTTPIKYWIDTGPEVTHFHYFARPDTAGRLVAALAGDDQQFHTLDAKPFAVSAQDYRKRAPGAQPIVFVVPGIMGSQLSIGSRIVWMDLTALARGGLSTLAMGAKNVEASGVVRSAYAELCQYLARTHEVIPFPYDWRQSLELSAARLEEAIEVRLQEADEHRQPIRLFAHSMGGLVVRVMLATRAGRKTWERMCEHPGARFIMLGTPNGGSHAISALLIGRDALTKKLALLDTRHDYQGLLQAVSQFDGLLDLLPDGGTLDLYGSADWARLFRHDAPTTRGWFASSVASTQSAGFAWTEPAAASLANARRVRDLIRSSPLDRSRMIYVAGAAAETACDIVIDESAAAGRQVRVLASAHGDGRVLWSTGIPAGIRTYYADTLHGDLASTREHFPAFLDLLTTGATSKLATTPPRRTRSISDTVELGDPMPAMVPDEEELIASALGGSRPREEEAEPIPRVHVQVVHDNLTNARSPVLVGHYDQDVIVAAEAALDRQLSGRLSELHRMELYPGPSRTSIVVLNDHEVGHHGHHPGAIVAGLGKVGEMTPGNLTATLEQALTAYGEEWVGAERRRRQRSGESGPIIATIPAPVTAVLVGSGEGGVTLSDSLQALLSAVAAANLRLARRDTSGGGTTAPVGVTAYINRVEILELYEDRAIEAVYALRNLARSDDLRHFVVEDRLVPGIEGRQRAHYQSGQAWWQRIRVKANDDGALEFEALTQLARAHASLKPTQRKLVEAFVDHAIGSTAGDPALGFTLFELLVPNDFKSYAPDRRNLVLVLNKAAAALPWELLHDHYDKGAAPLSVNSGMIRQLLAHQRREQVLRSSTATALVIGNPIVTDPQFADLPGAAEEAESVATQLTQAGYQVRMLIDEAAHPTAVLSALHEQPWRLLHLAAHGVFEYAATPGGAPISGLVLDHGVFLTPAEAEQMRHVPDIVFINCCHLGQTREDNPRRVAFHRLAANLATQFIEMGVRAVVAAGWAVDDAAAKAFASSFYAEMLAGSSFGDAVVSARRHIYGEFGGTNTWGAYQCYGDPGFALAKAHTKTHREGWAAPSEAMLWIAQLAADARSRDVTSHKQLLADLDECLAAIPPAWLDEPELCGIVAEAFGALGDFERAVARYETITRSERATASLRTLEQLANFKAVWAVELAHRPRPNARKAATLLRAAEKLLSELLEIGPTAERFSLLGSLHKRRAMIAGSATARRQAIVAMARAYDQAFAIAITNQVADDFYSLENRVAAQVVLSWLPGGSAAEHERIKKELKAGLAQLHEMARQLQASTTFFDLSATANHLLLTALATGAVNDASRQRIVHAYADAAQRGVTPRHRRSMADQLRFFIRMAAPLRSRQGTILKAQLTQLATELGVSE
jgi:triacylglycerol esterase/lipase EstA (alpha/beta hydrolase family)